METVGPVHDDDVSDYTAAAALPEGAPPSYFPPASVSSLPSYHQQQQQSGYFPPYPASSSPSYHQQQQQQWSYSPPDLASPPSYQQQQQQQWSYLPPDLAFPPSYQQQQQQWSHFPPDLPSPPSYHQLHQQQYEYYPCPPEPEAAGRFNGFPDFGRNGNVGFDGLLAMQRNLLTSAMRPPAPPAQMQTAPMEMPWNNPLQSAAVAMQGEHRSFESPWQATAAAAAAPVHAASFAPDDRAVVPVDAPPAAPEDRVVVPVAAPPFAPDDRAVVPVDAPPAAPPAKRPRGRPRGSTAASKSKLAGTSRKKKTGPRRRANPLPPPTPTPIQEPPTSEQPAAAADTSAVVVSQHHGDQPEHCGVDKKKTAEEALAALVDAEEDTEYADTSPTGVRFRPSDAEVIAFLQLKYLNRKMPIDLFKEFDVYKQHPDTIQETCGESVDGAWYVFWSRNRKYGFGGRPARSVENGKKVGFWKSNTKETEILVDGVAVGTVTALTFELGKQTGQSSHTAWKMKEYRIPRFQKECDGVMMLLDPWVMCKIYKAKYKPKEVAAVGGPTNVDESVNGTEGGGEEEATAGPDDGGEDGTAAGTEDGGEEETTAGTDDGGEEETTVGTEGGGEYGTAAGTEGGGEDGTAAGESVKERLDGVTDEEEQDLCVDDYFVSGDDDLFFLTEDDGDAVTCGGISPDNLLQ